MFSVFNTTLNSLFISRSIRSAATATAISNAALAALDASQHFAKEVHETFDVCDHDVRVDAVVSGRNAARALSHEANHGGCSSDIPEHWRTRRYVPAVGACE